MSTAHISLSWSFVWAVSEHMHYGIKALRDLPALPLTSISGRSVSGSLVDDIVYELLSTLVDWMVGYYSLWNHASFLPVKPEGISVPVISHLSLANLELNCASFQYLRSSSYSCTPGFVLKVLILEAFVVISMMQCNWGGIRGSRELWIKVFMDVVNAVNKLSGYMLGK